MANTVTLQVLEDGPRYAIIKASVVLDTSDLAETLIADPATLFIDQSAPTTMIAIDELKFAVQDGLALRLQWKATANTDAFVMVQAQRLCFEDEGAIHNNAGAGVNGQLVLISNGWVAPTMVASFVVKLLKCNT